VSAALLFLALTVGAVSGSFAQQIAPTGAYQEGVPVGSWTFYPKAFLGATYDQNMDQSPSGTDRDSGASLRLVPNLVATRDGGIHKTTVYGVVDAAFFNANTVAASVGFSHTYEAMRDLTFNFQGNYTRQTDLFNSAVNFNNGAIGPTASPDSNIPIVVNPFGTTPSANPIAYNQFAYGAAVTKTFGQAFVTLRGSAFYIAYDHSDTVLPPFQTDHNGASVWASGRVGYNVTPDVYVFAGIDGIWQRFDNGLFNTNGYRATGGVGTNNPNSLWRGEVYGGYQFQDQRGLNPNTNPGIPSDVDSGVFGGRLYYYPTRYWTFVASFDQILGISTALAPNIPQGIPTRSTTAMLQTNYGLSRLWTIGARFGYARGEYVGVQGLDTSAWMAGASFNYEIWRNLNLTLDYQYTIQFSDATFSEFTRNRYTGGLTYKY
jgi:hypothetical protein